MALSRLTWPQLALVTVLGVAGGLYVYKPIYQQYSLEQRKARERVRAGPAQQKEGEAVEDGSDSNSHCDSNAPES
ncbi:protein PIGBOS1 [Heptranchias perlo]|uniref:protein PIGBOS1 n=1 Tax=Heptranchias perlo TaxID=212740 RepID=UPI0035595875